MITWGISANSHDAALAVFNNDELVFASHSERYSRIKNDAHLNKEIINEAWTYGTPNAIQWYENPYKKTLRQVWAGQGWKYNENNIINYLRHYNICTPISFTNHHHSHAAAGYYTSSFSEACVIVIDSIGEYDTFSIWQGNGKRLKKVYSQKYPHSIGLWYSAMTQRVGLTPNEDEYVLMGMAAYGDPDRLYYDIKDDFFNNKTRLKNNLHRGCLQWRPDLHTDQDMFDIAAATQKVYETILHTLLNFAVTYYPSNNLVLMGGCALNCSANSITYDYFKNVWIMPNPGDAGSAIGCVLARTKKFISLDDVYLGHNIQGEYPVNKIIKELISNKICGVAAGKAEFGPRAFGNRSLLADPRGIDIKDRVNVIKQRQQFRPFAPVILQEHVDNYFTGPTSSYMQFTSKCTHAELYPAIVHADGTSRVQTVSKKSNSGIRKLLEQWYKLTGCPMLLNTSLNIKGKPMVNNLIDAKEFEQYYSVKVLTPT